MLTGLKYLVVGSGFAGAVIAERIATVLKEKVLVIDERKHIGGNSWSEIDEATGIECHKYGSHIFHTANENVWKYISQFGSFTGYRHKVLTKHNNVVYSMPINLHTINAFFGINLQPSEVTDFIAKEIGDADLATSRNLEEKAISQIGVNLYQAFIKNYTQKQWGRAPKDLPEFIINRLPVRNSYNSDYFNDFWQGVPVNGYFSLFKNIFSTPGIDVRTGVNYFDIRDKVPTDCKIIFTGMLDSFFDFKFGRLDWRSLRFEWETHPVQDFQGTTVMNYADLDVPYTRIHEFKHYHPERTEPFTSGQTVICKEYPENYMSGKQAYYPVNDTRNNQLFSQYQEEAKKCSNVIFAGRLGTYKYMDMDKTIAQALEIFNNDIA